MPVKHWERSIRHLDRRLGPVEQVRWLRGRLAKDAVRALRGLPTRSVPGELVLERLRLRFDHNPADPATQQALERLARAETHDRLTERKRAARHAAQRRRRPGRDSTKINLWQRRREWLRRVEELQEGAAGEAWRAAGQGPA